MTVLSTMELANQLKVRIVTWARNNEYPKDKDDIFNGLVDKIGRLARIRKKVRRMEFPLVDKPENICRDILVYAFRYADFECSNLGDLLQTLLDKTEYKHVSKLEASGLNKKIEEFVAGVTTPKSDIKMCKTKIVKRIRKVKKSKKKGGWIGKPIRKD